MFIKVKRFNMECLLNIHKIEAVIPMDEGKRTSVKAEGHSFDWEIPFDMAQDTLIDNAAQVTAPIASRITGLDNTVARLARSVEDWLELATTPILNVDGMTPEESARFKASMREAEATLNSIQPRLRAGSTKSVTERMLETDVTAVSQLLEDHEWAEHCTASKLGLRLESAVTDLHNQHSKTREDLEKALGFLSWVRHEYQQSGQIGVFHFSEMEKIAEFLRDRENNPCEKE